MFGDTIEKIRLGKKIPIKVLTEDILTRAAYHRFTVGQSRTNIDNFFTILNRLNTSPDEFFLIHNNFENDKVMLFLKSVSKAYKNKDLTEMIHLRKAVVKEDFNELKKDHLLDLLNFRINRLCGHCTDGSESQSNLYEYLIKTEFWTHYELVLFTNSMYIFSLELIDTILVRCIQGFNKFSPLRPYGSESFRLVINALIVAYEQKEDFYIKKWMSMLNTLKIEDSNFFEKTLYKVFVGFYEIKINQNLDYEADVLKVVEYVEHIDSKDNAAMLKNMLAFILKSG